MYPELFNVPIVRNGKEATVGYCRIFGPSGREVSAQSPDFPNKKV